MNRADSCLGRRGRPFIHFFLIGEQLLNARALLHALEMPTTLGKHEMSTVIHKGESDWLLHLRKLY
jgi:hypothetical protein